LEEEPKSVQSQASTEAEVLALLRTPGLSIKNLDPATKEKIRLYILAKHIEQGVSLSDIAKLIGNKTSGYTSWLTRQLGIQPRPFEEARLEGIHKKVRKHERKPFDGTDEDKAYLLELLHGDLHASRPWKDAVKISTSTTHPAMAELFISLFEKYGHVYLDPRYKKETDSYEWNLSANLDNSFEFMFMSHAECWNWVSMEDSRILSYLAGLFDAEGTIGVHPNALNISLTVAYFNTNLELLNQVCVAWQNWLPSTSTLSPETKGYAFVRLQDCDKERLLESSCCNIRGVTGPFGATRFPTSRADYQEDLKSLPSQGRSMDFG